MQEIFSINNELIKNCAKLKQKKYRALDNLFIIEGSKCVEDAILHNITLEHIFVLKDKIQKFSYDDAILVDEKVMQKLSDTQSAPEILAVAKIPECEFKKDKYNKIAVLEDIKDAGNLGTIIRSACAFGLDAIIMTGDCIDLYNPKVIRSSVGNIFKLPVFKLSLDEIKQVLKNYTLYSTIVKGGQDLSDIKFAQKSAILFGSEADGITQDLKNLATQHITLKMATNVESLNLAICASIIFYEMQNK